MLQKVLIITFRVITARVTAAALFTCKSTLNNCMSDLQQIAKLDILRKSSVINMGSITDIAVCIFLLQRIELLACLEELCLIAENTGLEPHRVNHSITNLRNGLAFAAAAVRYRLECILSSAAVLSQLVLTACVGIAPCIFRCTVARCTSKYKNLGKRVCPRRFAPCTETQLHSPAT